MTQIAMPVSRNRLGAIELVELGRGPVMPVPLGMKRLNRPFLSNSRAHLGINFADIGSFLTGAFEFLFNTLADIVNVPLDLASQGIGVLFDGLAGIIANVPILGPLAAQVLLLGKSVIQWGLSVPGLLLEGVGNIFGEIKGAIDATRTDEEKDSDAKKAKEKILEKAEEKGGSEFKDQVKNALEGKTVTGADGREINPKNDPPEGGEGLGKEGEETQLESILKVGLPVAGAAALVFVALG